MNSVLQSIESRQENERELHELMAELHKWGPQCAIISFPYMDRKNVLRHILFGHEIGHLVVDRCVHSFWTDEQDAIRTFIHNKLLAIYKSTDKEEEHILSLFVGRFVDDAVTYLKRGAEEILCDLCAIRVFGPVVAFAAYEVAILQGLNISPRQANYYPPWRLRLSQMVRAADESWLEKLKLHEGRGDFARTVYDRAKQSWDTITKDTAVDVKDYVAIDDDMLRVVYAFLIDDILPALEKKIYGYIDSKIAPLEMDGNRVDDLLNRLRNGIPPAEVCERDSGPLEIAPSSLREVFTVGWLYHVNRMHEEGFVSNDDYHDTCNRLLLKAIESAELSREYNAWKKGAGVVSA